MYEESQSLQQIKYTVPEHLRCGDLSLGATRSDLRVFEKAYHFDRDDVALPNIGAFYKKRGEKKKADADKLIEFQNKRGGRVKLQDILKPEKDDWGNGVDSMKTALDLERKSQESYSALHDIAESNHDEQMSDFIEEFLETNITVIKTLADHVTNLTKMGQGLGEYMFDKELK